MGLNRNINGALQQRLRFIDFLLDHYGYFKRGMVADYFGLSTPQVSMDVQVYLDVTGGMAVYNLSARRYERAANFKRTWP